MAKASLEWLIHETGLYSLMSSGTRDTYLILASRFLRMFAYGGVALVLAIFLRITGIEWTEVGTFMSIALLGDAAISYFLALKADKIGRRRVLLIGSSLMVFSGTIFTFFQNYWVLLFAAVVGVITPGAHEVGPFRAVQESTLAHITPIEARTDMYAWFAVSSTLGMASGLFIAGWMTYVQKTYMGYDWKECFPAIFGMYAVVGLIKVCLTLFLTERCEAGSTTAPRRYTGEVETSSRPLLSGGDRQRSYTKAPEVTSRARRIGRSMTTKVSAQNRPVLIRLCILFAINSFASGMIPVTLMSWYVNYRFRWFLINRVGYAMSAVWLVSAFGQLASASVARRLGLVRTMVLMHLPNAIFLGFIPLAPTWWTFLILLFASASLGSMDQAPRMAFVAAIFKAEERTAVMGTINLVRTVSAAGGPIVTGYLLHHKMMWVAFVMSAALKVSYDMGLLAMFVNTKLPEGQVSVADADVNILLSEDLARPEEFDVMEEDADEVLGNVHGEVTYREDVGV